MTHFTTRVPYPQDLEGSILAVMRTLPSDTHAERQAVIWVNKILCYWFEHLHITLDMYEALEPYFAQLEEAMQVNRPVYVDNVVEFRGE